MVQEDLIKFTVYNQNIYFYCNNKTTTLSTQSVRTPVILEQLFLGETAVPEYVLLATGKFLMVCYINHSLPCYGILLGLYRLILN